MAPSRASARALHARLRRSWHDVRRVLPRWDGRLTAYLPRDRAQFDELIGSRGRGYDRVAAVTTSTPGGKAVGTNSVIVINPQLWRRLGPMGSRVVLTHEATHVATGSDPADRALWVSEGFADFVAIAAVHVGPDVAASAALATVRRHGPPRRLPSDADFAPGRGADEISYEQAWLAVRLLASTYGRARLVAFQADVTGRHGDVDRALARRFGTTVPGFTERFRRALVQLADAH